MYNKLNMKPFIERSSNISNYRIQIYLPNNLHYLETFRKCSYFKFDKLPNKYLPKQINLISLLKFKLIILHINYELFVVVK